MRVVLFTYGSDLERELRRAFSAAGHDFRPIEPDFPQCKSNVDHARPEIILLDATSPRPSHVRETAGYFADLKQYRDAPVYVVSSDPADVSRFRSKIPRAQHVTPSAALAAVQ